jgi:hypothetical protein
MCPLWLASVDVSKSGLLVYMVLSYHSRGGHALAFPRLETLMAETHLSRAAVKRGLNELKAVGAIVGHEQHLDSGASAPTAYAISLVQPAESEDQLTLAADDEAEWEEPEGEGLVSEPPPDQGSDVSPY